MSHNDSPCDRQSDRQWVPKSHLKMHRSLPASNARSTGKPIHIRSPQPLENKSWCRIQTKDQTFPIEWLQWSYSSFPVVHSINTKNVCWDNCLSGPIKVGNLDRRLHSELTFPTAALNYIRQRLYKLSDRTEPEFIREMNWSTQRLCILNRIRLS